MRQTWPRGNKELVYKPNSSFCPKSQHNTMFQPYCCQTQWNSISFLYYYYISNMNKRYLRFSQQQKQFWECIKNHTKSSYNYSKSSWLLKIFIANSFLPLRLPLSLSLSLSPSLSLSLYLSLSPSASFSLEGFTHKAINLGRMISFLRQYTDSL